MRVKLIGCIALAFVPVFIFRLAHCEMTDSEYRTKFMKAEREYSRGDSKRLKEAERAQEVKLYLEMGKAYLDAKDFASSLICYRKVIELEKNSPQKPNTKEAADIIARIEINLKEQIEGELSSDFSQDWNRLSTGSGKILSRYPPDYSKKLDEEQRDREALQREEERQRKLKEEWAKMQRELKERKAQLEREMEYKKMALQREMEEKKLAFAQKQAEIAEIIAKAGELFEKNDYNGVIALCDKALQMDENNIPAKELKNNCLLALEKQRYLASKKDIDTWRILTEQKFQEMKLQEEKIKAMKEQRRKEGQIHLDKGKEFLKGNNFQEALIEFSKAVQADQDNFEAKQILAELRDKLKKAMGVLDNYKEEAVPDIAPAALQAAEPVAVSTDNPSGQ